MNLKLKYSILNLETMGSSLDQIGLQMTKIFTKQVRNLVDYVFGTVSVQPILYTLKISF